MGGADSDGAGAVVAGEIDDGAHVDAPVATPGVSTKRPDDDEVFKVKVLRVEHAAEQLLQQQRTMFQWR